MPLPTQEQALAVLRGIATPDNAQDIVTAGHLRGVIIEPANDGALIRAALDIDPADARKFEPIRLAAENALRAIAGVTGASVVLTAHRDAPTMQAKTERPERIMKKLDLPHIKNIVAIASGKGGVGKSTTAVNIAIALKRRGLRVGLVDADIYGPSIPRMMNLTGKPETTADKKLIPLERFGLATMSMGYMIAEDTPMIWRGPMVHTAIQQLFKDVAWGERDVLVVDLPPGTGDAQLTLAQTIPLTGAVIVSTPQDIALIDARKGLGMFQKVDVPIMGIIENMSYFICPHCNGRSDIFSHGGARHEAEKLNVPFLGEIPLDIKLRVRSDEGEPIAEHDEASDIAQRYLAIADEIAKQLKL